MSKSNNRCETATIRAPSAWGGSTISTGNTASATALLTNTGISHQRESGLKHPPEWETPRKRPSLPVHLHRDWGVAVPSKHSSLYLPWRAAVPSSVCTFVPLTHTHCGWHTNAARASQADGGGEAHTAHTSHCGAQEAAAASQKAVQSWRDDFLQCRHRAIVGV